MILLLLLLLSSPQHCDQLDPLIELKKWAQLSKTLQEKPQLWHCNDPYGVPLMHHFAYNNQLKLLKTGIEQHHIDPNLKDHRDWTLLHGATAGDAPDTTRYLLSIKSICLTCKTKKKHLPIFLGIRRDALKSTLLYAIKHKGLSLRDDQNRTILMATIATCPKPLKMFQILLKGNLDLNAKDIEGNRAIHWAIYGDQFNLVKILIDAGADYRSGNSDGITPMMLASGSSNISLMKTFIKYGIDINKRDQTGKTALHHAIDGNEDGIPVDLLLRSGAISDLKDINGSTPLMHAMYNTSGLDLMKQLIDGGAPLHIGDQAKTELLIWLSQQKSIKTSPRIRSKIIRFLLRYGQGLNTSEKDQLWIYVAKTAASGEDIKLLNILKNRGIKSWMKPEVMVAAVTHDVTKTVRWLQQHSAPIDGERKDGITPLIKAVQSNNFPMIRLLLHYGADPNVKNSLGKTAFDYLKKNQRGIKDLLKIYLKKK